MLTYLVELADQFPALNLLRYITVRSALAVIVALLATMFLSARIQRSGQAAGSAGLRTGGLALWGFLIAAILAGDLSNPFSLIVLCATTAAGVLGWVGQKLDKRQFARAATVTMIILVALLAAWLILVHQRDGSAYPGRPVVPFERLDIALVLANAALIAASTYCVKLAGDVDDDVVIASVIVAFPYTFVAYFAGNAVFSNYLQIRFAPGIGEYAVLVAALIGAGIGIMWFTSSLPRFQIGVGTRFSFGMFIGIGAVGTHSQVLHAIAIAILAIEPLSIYFGYRRSTGLRKTVLSLAPFIRGRNR